MKLFKCLAVLVVILASIAASAETPHREVTVTGRSEVRVVPNEVVLSFAVETMNEDLNLSKQANDIIVTAALETVRDLGLGTDQVKTAHMNIEPIYNHSGPASRGLLGYKVANSIVVISQDIELVEDLLSGLLEAGVNRVVGVEFRTSDYREYRDKALLMALDAAKEKAQAMSERLGSKIGKPVSISEGAPRYRASMSNSVQFTPSVGDWLNGPLAPGEISIPASASVTFELID